MAFHHEAGRGRSEQPDNRQRRARSPPRSKRQCSADQGRHNDLWGEQGHSGTAHCAQIGQRGDEGADCQRRGRDREDPAQNDEHAAPDRRGARVVGGHTRFIPPGRSPLPKHSMRIAPLAVDWTMLRGIRWS